MLDTYLIMSCLSSSEVIEVPERWWQWWDLNSECCDKQLIQRLGDLGLISIRVVTLLFVLMVEEGYCRCERSVARGGGIWEIASGIVYTVEATACPLRGQRRIK